MLPSSPSQANVEWVGLLTRFQLSFWVRKKAMPVAPMYRQRKSNGPR